MTAVASSAAGPSAAELRAFAERGVLRVRGAFAAADAAAIVDHLWDRLAATTGVQRDDPATWTRSWDGLGAAANAPVFRRVATERLRAALDACMGGARWAMPRRWNMIRMNPAKPAATPWSVPADGWHWDAAPGDGLMVFLLYAPLAPGGGGTLVAEGAHRLLARFLADPAMRGAPMRELKRRFAASHPWLARLTGAAPRSADGAEFLVDADAGDGLPLRVVEACGDAGDAVICPASAYHVAAGHHAGPPRCLSIKVIRALAD